MNVRKSAIKIVKKEQVKVADQTLWPKGNRDRRMSFVCILVVDKSLGRQQAPNPPSSLSGTWKPRIAPRLEVRQSQEKLMAMRVWEVGKSERCPVMGQIQV